MAPTQSSIHAQNDRLAPLLSLVVPGAGQFVLGRRWRGILILLSTVTFAFLIYWALVNFETSKVVVGGLTTSWLWALLAAFWLWNVWDARQTARGGSGGALLSIVLIAIILYVIAWDVTDIKLERMITRFGNAQKVMADLVRPNLFERDGKGNLIPSRNFTDIFGSIKSVPATGLIVQLGYATRGEEVRTYVPGKLIETIAIGLLATIFSTLLAIPLSFFAAHNIMSRVRGGTAVYYVMRTILNVVRAVDTMIWGIVVIVWVGLGSFAGVIALTIHSVAALAKLYSEEIEHIDPGPVEAITATGANLFQVMRYAVVPQIIPSFLAYTLLRWDINMRSATIVGFVAGGGIGYFVVETIRMAAYSDYAAALWAVAVVIILVDMISGYWRQRILSDQPPKVDTVRRSFFTSLRAAVYIILGLAVFVYSWHIAKIDLRQLFEPAPTFIRLVRDFLSFDFSAKVMDAVILQLLITIFQALLATTLGGIIAIPFSFLAAKNLTGRSRLSAWLYYLTRASFNILRSIEALLYVAIFVFWVGIGPFAGTLALAVTTFGLIGKLFSEAIENIDAGPMEAITATGASRLQVIVYAILPQIVPPFLSYVIYQWDINIRMATIIGFAGGGGIGLLLSTYFGQLQYHKAGTVVLFIVIVVALMDFASAKIRERLV
jgi:phosphonate transport system permease protein